MGGWKLESIRMAMYVGFPVGCFYLFNKPELFKDIIIEGKKKFYRPEAEEAVS